jgi:hypothetical protein
VIVVTGEISVVTVIVAKEVAYCSYCDSGDRESLLWLLRYC